MRTPVIVVALLAAALWAAPAEAKLVYVKHAASASPMVYVATDRGKDPRRLGVGRAPTISPDGRWVAFVTVRTQGSNLDTVVTQRLRAGSSRRLVFRSRSVDSLRFSPDSKTLAAVAAGKRVRVYDIAADESHVTAVGNLRGYSFSPDGEQIVYGRAVKDDIDARSDLYVVPARGGEEKRLTTVKNAINPVWGPESIVFDRFTARDADAPAYQLWSLDPAAPKELRQLTDLKIPALVSGLVPLEISSDSRRMLAVFTGQDVEVGFTVALASGKLHPLSRDFESGTVGFDLSSDGSTILAHTGGPDPGAAHDVVTVPYARGGKPKVIVEDAAYPDWNR